MKLKPNILILTSLNPMSVTSAYNSLLKLEKNYKDVVVSSPQFFALFEVMHNRKSELVAPNPDLLYLPLSFVRAKQYRHEKNRANIVVGNAYKDFTKFDAIVALDEQFTNKIDDYIEQLAATLDMKEEEIVKSGNMYKESDAEITFYNLEHLNIWLKKYLNRLEKKGGK